MQSINGPKKLERLSQVTKKIKCCESHKCLDLYPGLNLKETRLEKPISDQHSSLLGLGGLRRNITLYCPPHYKLVSDAAFRVSPTLNPDPEPDPDPKFEFPYV